MVNRHKNKGSGGEVEIEEHEIMYSGVPNYITAQTVVGWKKDLRQKIIEWAAISQGIMRITIKLTNNSVRPKRECNKRRKRQLPGPGDI